MSPYGTLLRERRLAAKLSLRTVARCIGVSHVFLSDVENGRRAPLTKSRETGLGALLSVSQDELDGARALSRPCRIVLEAGIVPPTCAGLVSEIASRLAKRAGDEEVLRRVLLVLEA